MSGTCPRISDLTPAELEILAQEHVENMFKELRAKCEVVHEQNPVRLVKRYPFATAKLAAVAAFMLVQYLRRKPTGSSREKVAAPDLFDSLLSSMACAVGCALSELVASWLTQKSKSG